jgi:ABC-type multidrug transport system fused ATPase/permease subunit
MNQKYNKMQIWTIIAFLIVPLLSSFISTYHIVGFFDLGNYTWMAVVLAIAFELGSIASALSITILDKISKFAVWTMFFTLIAFQIIGNVYYTFDYITLAEKNYPEYLENAKVFLTYFYEFETFDDLKMFLSLLIGVPIPLISLAFLKTLVDYVSNVKKEISEKEDSNSNFEELIDEIDLPEEYSGEDEEEDETPEEDFSDIEEDVEDDTEIEEDEVELIDPLEDLKPQETEPLSEADFKTFLDKIEIPEPPKEELKKAVEKVKKEKPKKEKKTLKIVNSSGAVEEVNSKPPVKLGENKMSVEEYQRQNKQMKEMLQKLYPSAKGKKFDDSELK